MLCVSHALYFSNLGVVSFREYLARKRVARFGAPQNDCRQQGSKCLHKIIIFMLRSHLICVHLGNRCQNYPTSFGNLIARSVGNLACVNSFAFECDLYFQHTHTALHYTHTKTLRALYTQTKALLCLCVDYKIKSGVLIEFCSLYKSRLLLHMSIERISTKIL